MDDDGPRSQNNFATSGASAVGRALVIAYRVILQLSIYFLLETLGIVLEDPFLYAGMGLQREIIKLVPGRGFKGFVFRRWHSLKELRNGHSAKISPAKRTFFEYDHMPVQTPNAPQSVRQGSGKRISNPAFSLGTPQKPLFSRVG
ncbi:hypothetical protein TNIN_239121 [Trichonephila inaurata madagascariensis]|uniref:Uncharacterized protein n=1 Tax=Trichonephila inaurata madagascariensis TaxID=2747483 RepID=A0A8X7CFZ6_9ARAC|nr:hypothetical protein TNIN_239121 [Trichonephila inaurata madagascariensis]